MLSKLKIIIGRLVRLVLGPAAHAGRQVLDGEARLVLTPRQGRIDERLGQPQGTMAAEGARKVGAFWVIDGGLAQCHRGPAASAVSSDIDEMRLRSTPRMFRQSGENGGLPAPSGGRQRLC